MPPKYLTVREVAEQLRVHPETVRTMTRRGELPGFKIGSGSRAAYRFDPVQIDATVERWKRQSR